MICPICEQAPATETVVGVSRLICKGCARIVHTEVSLQAGYLLDRHEKKLREKEE